ncbi:cbb3-type cytochrome oxidase assembly protein CcoS [Paracoccaceae bacterium]
MNYCILIPISVGLGLTGLCAFFWALRHDQYDDLAGAAARILNAPDAPIPPAPATEPGQAQPVAQADRGQRRVGL